MKRYAVIVAGGSGTRMESDLPKQFIQIDGRPILMHTILKFVHFDPNISIVVVLPYNQIKQWESLCEQHNFNIAHQVTPGGSTRFQSVRNGLELIKDDNSIVAIHDGVRPFVSSRTISNTFKMAAENGNAIPVIEAFESVRITDEEGNRAVDRRNVKLVQTPQVFKSALIKQAYLLPYQDFFTDDASVAEAAGNDIFITEGNRENIKITTPFDLKVAQLLIEEKL